jgi:hypothetical protein
MFIHALPLFPGGELLSELPPQRFREIQRDAVTNNSEQFCDPRCLHSACGRWTWLNPDQAMFSKSFQLLEGGFYGKDQ